jgi:hypothetical protein
VFDFQVPYLGQGLDLSISATTAREINNFALGLGAGFIHRGSYSPFKDQELNYNPGDEISFSLGLDRPIHRNSRMMLDISYCIYTQDKAEKIAIFKSGNKLLFAGAYCYDSEFYSLVISANGRLKAKNHVGSGRLVAERLNSNCSEFEIGATAGLKLHKDMTVRAALEGKLYSNNELEIGGAKLAGIGGGIDKNVSQSVVLDADLRFYFGSLDQGYKSVGLTGLKLLGGIKIFI